MDETIEANGHRLNLAVYRAALIAWGEQNFRSFPWRLTDDPYRVLMAEVMLHRTQAAQVVPVYINFVGQYPNVEALAAAKREELNQALYSLGLQWRIDLIHDMAHDLVSRFGSQVPGAKDDLLSLPGVSDYIASAVRCFAFDLPDAIVDTNTVRVVGRLFGIETKDSSRRNTKFRALITALVDPQRPRAYNYALLDLAAQVCTKRFTPQHERCPVAVQCLTAKLKLEVESGDDGRA